MTEMAFPWFEDPLRLAGSSADRGPIVHFGTVDASVAIRAASASSSVGELSSATIALDAGAPVVADIDFTAEVKLAHANIDTGRWFTGYVTGATHDDGLLQVICSGRPQLHDPLPGAFVSRAPLDAMYALFRDAGVRDEKMFLQGLDQLPTEIFEVVAVVEGVKLTEPVRVGAVTFVPSGHVTESARVLGDEPLVQTFIASEAFAITYVTATRLYDAERAGTSRIEPSVAWTNVRLRYANAISPDGVFVGWNRDQLRQVARQGELILVRGVATGRAWLRRRGQPIRTEVTLDKSEIESVDQLRKPRLNNAFVSAGRAISSSDPISRINAISECLEFYAGATKFNYGFTKSDRKKLLKAAKELSEDKQRRVDTLVGHLNEAPLLARVRLQCARDGVPISDDDFSVIERVRTQRNDLVHGRTLTVDAGDVERAIAILARILLYAEAAGSEPTH